MTEWLDAYLLAKVGAEKDYKAEWEWWRYMLRGKLFAAICTPDAKYGEYGGHVLLSLKCPPEDGEILRAAYKDILPGFYMDKRNWISILLDGEVPQDVIMRLCDKSHELILKGFPKKVQAEIMGEAK